MKGNTFYGATIFEILFLKKKTVRVAVINVPSDARMQEVDSRIEKVTLVPVLEHV